jgi:hypothetical protein
MWREIITEAFILAVSFAIGYYWAKWTSPAGRTRLRAMIAYVRRRFRND